MADIIDLMKELGCPTVELGVCHGIALMAERARLRGQYEQFATRMKYLNALEANTLANLIQNAESKIKAENQGLTPEDNLLLTIKTFIAQIYAYQKPSLHQQFLGLKGPFLSQNDIKKSDALMYDDGPGAKDLVPLSEYKRFLICSEKTNNWLTLMNFIASIKASLKPVGVLIGSGSHVVHLFYNMEKMRWSLTNHSFLTDYSDDEDLVLSLTNAFELEDCCILSIDVFMDELAENKQVVKKLNIISQNCLKEVYESSNPNRSNPNGSTLLYIAALVGCMDVVKALLPHKKIAINQAKNNGATPLCIAAQNGHIDVVKALLADSRTLVNQATNDGATPLYIAAQNGHIAVVKALLERTDIAINQAIKEGMTPLYIAAQNGHIDVVKALLADSRILVNQATNDDVTPLYIAAQNGHIDVFKALLEKSNTVVNKAIYKYNGATPLYIAAQNGHIDVVKLLLADLNIQVNQATNDGMTPLKIAAHYKHSQVVEAIEKAMAGQYKLQGFFGASGGTGTNSTPSNSNMSYRQEGQCLSGVPGRI